MDSIEANKKYKQEKKLCLQTAKDILKKEKSKASSKAKKISEAQKQEGAINTKKKKNPSTKLKGILGELTLIYAKIKRTDKNGYGYCITCGVFGRWDTMQGGHFMPVSKGLSTKFELDNINLQCSGCNGRGNQGEQYKHGLYIEIEFGVGRSYRLIEQAGKLRKWKVYELEEAIADVESRIVDLCEENSKEWVDILIGYITKNSARKAKCKNLLFLISKIHDEGS